MQPAGPVHARIVEEQKGVSQVGQSQDRAKPPWDELRPARTQNDLSPMFSAFAVSSCGCFLTTSQFS